MRRRYVTIDVFTERVFGGNPLAVVLDAQGLTSSQMQSIANEFNYSETTFVLPAAVRRSSQHWHRCCRGERTRGHRPYADRFIYI